MWATLQGVLVGQCAAFLCDSWIHVARIECVCRAWKTEAKHRAWKRVHEWHVSRRDEHPWCEPIEWQQERARHCIRRCRDLQGDAVVIRRVLDDRPRRAAESDARPRRRERSARCGGHGRVQGKRDAAAAAAW